MNKYIIVSGTVFLIDGDITETLKDFTKLVNEKIEEGYEPLGSSRQSGGFYCQAMIKKD
jgi:hypothetical protein